MLPRTRSLVILVFTLAVTLGGAPASAGAASAATAAFPGTVLLGQPTATSVTVSLMASAATDVFIEYGSAARPTAARTATTRLAAGQPVELTLSGLTPNAATVYRIRHRAAGATTFAATPAQSFSTQRSPSSTFTFDIDADPHIDVDAKMQPDLFRQALANIAADRPDFLVDLGDTFLGDKFAKSYPQLAVQYAGARGYFGISGPSVPLFLVNGNHEGEAGWLLDGTANNLSVWAATARKLYYPEPTAGSFYSGSTVSEPFVGRRNSYYAWTWGDALFVVLDPYAYATVNPKQTGDGWDWTLGETQYRWLQSVLGTSTQTYKFVFAHHAVGDIRGGVELADLFDWGGHARNGADLFATERPGWSMPVQQLMATYGVTIFFQGHDHLYVRQEHDGVVYQEVPQPASPGPANNADAYSSGGIVYASTGHLRVTVAPGGVTVAYVHASTGVGDTSGLINGQVVYSYTVARPLAATSLAAPRQTSVPTVPTRI